MTSAKPARRPAEVIAALLKAHAASTSGCARQLGAPQPGAPSPERPSRSAR